MDKKDNLKICKEIIEDIYVGIDKELKENKANISNVVIERLNCLNTSFVELKRKYPDIIHNNDFSNIKSKFLSLKLDFKKQSERNLHFLKENVLRILNGNEINCDDIQKLHQELNSNVNSKNNTVEKSSKNISRFENIQLEKQNQGKNFSYIYLENEKIRHIDEKAILINKVKELIQNIDKYWENMTPSDQKYIESLVENLENDL